MRLETAQVLADKDKYFSLFESLEKGKAAKISSWISPIRKAAISRFREMDFPTTRQEEWKYTNVDPIVQSSFRFASTPASNGLTVKQIEGKFGLQDSHRLVFVNGFYSKSLSSVFKLPQKTVVLDFKSAALKSPNQLRKHLGQYVSCDRNIFAALNTAFIYDGAFVYLPEGVTVERPLHLLFIALSHGEKIISQPRNLIVMGPGSSATLVESYVAVGQDPYFTNTVTEIVLDEGASLDHYKLQKESQSAFHIATTHVKCHQDSVFSSFSLDVGGRIARNNLSVSLDGEGCQCALNGLYLAGGTQHIDNTTVIDHTKPHGTSRQLYKGILDEKATAVFSGKIFVRKNAQKTDAAQKNKNLLLSDGAKVDTKPQLEIFADDVKCAHGAAVGQLDEEEIFYLKSRGMGEEKARSVLTYGFANEVISRIECNPIRKEMDRLLQTRFLKDSAKTSVDVRVQETVRLSKKPSQKSEIPFDVRKLRRDFPILRRKIHGKPLVYLDNAATTQKPRVVIDALLHYYTSINANVHRGVHFLSEQATHAYESARVKVQRFLNARESREIIFVRGATEGINLVARSYGKLNVKKGDDVIISSIEHHSNIVAWQILCEQTGANLKVIPVNDNGELLLDEYEQLLSERTKLVAVGHMSNALGTINPVRRMIEMAHRWNAKVLIDGAQAAPHLAVDVKDLDCDFYVFSGHKLYGPTGIGVLYGKAELLDVMPPYQAGGDMISWVTFGKTLYNTLPYKFEAGTPHIEGVVGLGAAIDYVNGIGLEAIATYEQELLVYGTQALSAFPGIKIIGTAKEKGSILSFVMDGVHPHDIATILDRDGIAIRAGHHCAMPVMERFAVPATARASLAFYNTKQEIDKLILSLRHVREVFK